MKELEDVIVRHRLSFSVNYVATKRKGKKLVDGFFCRFNEEEFAYFRDSYPDRDDNYRPYSHDVLLFLLKEAWEAKMCLVDYCNYHDKTHDSWDAIKGYMDATATYLKLCRLIGAGQVQVLIEAYIKRD